MSYLDNIKERFYLLNQPSNSYLLMINSDYRELEERRILAEDDISMILNDPYHCCLRKTPDGQSNVGGLVGVGDLIKSWDKCYGDTKYTDYIVESLYHKRLKNGIEYHCITVSHPDEYTQLKRCNDGHMPESSICCLNRYVAQDGLILPLFFNDISAIEVLKKGYMVKKNKEQLLIF